MATQIATVAMLMRSVALDRWITVAACLLLLAASHAGTRGRTWGVSLAFMLGVTFLGICALGIAPPMFALLGFLAVRPFARMFRHFVHFDRGAALLLATGAGALGAAGALAWKAFAFDLFAAFPALVPSLHPHHGVLVAAIGAAASVVGLLQTRAAERAAEGEASEATTRRVRIADDTDAVAEAEALAELEVDAEQKRLGAR